MDTIVLGLGNPLLTDDGVGLAVAEALKDSFEYEDVTVIPTSLAGLSLLDLLEGHHRAIIVDAIQTEGGVPGQVYRLTPGDFKSALHAESAHDVNLATALELGRRLGMAVPRQVVIFGIEIADVATFSETCTPAVRAAVPRCVEMIVREVKGGPDAQSDDRPKHPVGGTQRGCQT